MKRGLTGRYEANAVGGERMQAFIPSPLPPYPPLDLTGALQQQLERAHLALGRLDAISVLLPDTELFIYAYVRKEAVLSSLIEGTESSLSDLLLFEMNEMPGVPLDDVTEVSNYVAAMDHALARLREGFPLSNRLLREMHGILLASGRGSWKAPGEFRRTQNWIGGSRPGNARFVPPPPNHVPDCMSQLERFLHETNDGLPVVLRAGLAHVQFETIHPFLDGNGRVGRLLITLLMCHSGVLQEPLLYLSLYFKKHRDMYYRLLDQIRTEGDWEAWLSFFLDGVAETADGAVATAQRLSALFAADRESILPVGRRAGSMLRVLDAMKSRPVTSIPAVVKTTGLSTPTAGMAMEELVSLGIARELTGRRRNRAFAYDGYIAILNEGTERP
jgi:Fic family protein